MFIDKLGNFLKRSWKMLHTGISLTHTKPSNYMAGWET